MSLSSAYLTPGGDIRIEGKPGGRLSGLTFVAKDLFDIAGHPTGAGNHDWARTHAIPTKHAWAVQTLLDAGATLVGKSVTDEISLGILGENAFDGTPLNPKAPDRVPGGSSSGSVSAVAQGACDFALGTDTGGSVRVPASFCGVYGIRPTHGRLPLDGMLPQAPSSDTTGWFARDADTFARVSHVLLGEPVNLAPAQAPGRCRRCVWLCRPGRPGSTHADGRPSVPSHRRGERRDTGASGSLGLGARATHPPALGGLGDVQRLD